ncbi:AAA family ATPase [Bacillus toyonensis]|uniref:AAA family ATPase n=1 Tax=Bacillus toyonensis TaxID=155322 RepID=UPI002852F9F5|nr:AAA family ATPase [Bacillus toyonensis]MDR4970575.1 AAA family ATPase [Bacillus toyonensis]
MELLYLWVDNYQEGLIDKQGLNFDNRFRYQMKEKNEKYELNIKANPNFIEDFFKPEDKSLEEIAEIKNITAIVGQNGTGKSSILDFLKENFGASGAEDDGEKVKNYLYITREYRGKEFLHYIYFPKEMNININIRTQKEYVYEIRNDQDIPCDLEKTTLIYFSNVYDNKEEYSVENMVNISTNHLTNIDLPKGNGNFVKSESFDFKFKEIKRQIQFVYALKDELKDFELPFKVPTQIDLFYRGGHNRLSLNRNALEERDKNILDSIQELSSLINSSTKGTFDVNVSPNIRNELIGFTRCILKHLYIELREDKWINIIKKIQFTMPQRGDFKDDYDWLRGGLKKFALILKSTDQKLGQLVNMLNSLDILMERFYSQYLYYKMEKSKNGMRYKFSFGIEEDDGKDFQEFLNLYEKACIKNDFIDFSWRNLSSGENALLNIYARFYFASKRWELTKNIDNDLIILIDEGEVYLHPHWQGKLLNNLIEYFPILFRNMDGRQRNIQIILTSNSPFVVSDLPSTNIIFLKKEMEKSVVIDSLEEYHQTFAANIHSLLAHSFFMEDGVTGAFAKRKINEIIQLLIKEDSDTIFQNEEKITRTINLIGEPVIRNKLFQMLTDRQSISMVNVNSEIQKLRLRIEKLEKLKNDTNQA